MAGSDAISRRHQIQLHLVEEGDIVLGLCEQVAIDMMVIEIELCPRITWIFFTGQPCSMISEAQVWYSAWNPNFGCPFLSALSAFSC